MHDTAAAAATFLQFLHLSQQPQDSIKYVKTQDDDVEHITNYN